MKLTIALPALLLSTAGLALDVDSPEAIRNRAETLDIYTRAQNWVDEHHPPNRLQSRAMWKRCDKPNPDGTCNPDPTCATCKDCIKSCSTFVGFAGSGIGGCTIGCDTNIICSSPCGGNYINNIPKPDSCGDGPCYEPASKRSDDPVERDAQNLAAVGSKRKVEK